MTGKIYKIIHNFGYDINASKEEKKAKVDEKIKMVIESGYKGLVTNVSFNNYMLDENEWEILDYIVDKAEENGLKLWFYDEKGWPSGTAGGLTLKANPEYESKAVVAIVKQVKAKEQVAIEFPYNHMKVLYAVAYTGSNLDDINFDSAENLTNELDEKGNLIYTNNSDIDKVVGMFVLRQFYEGAITSTGLFAARRSIDVSDERAINEFINNTYKKYNERYKGRYQAYFTDEPGYPGFYYIVKRANQVIDDKPDWNTPLHPPVNWGNNFAEKFKKIKGYDIIPYLPYLFGNESKQAKKVRFDYQEVLSELYEKAFFRQISDYCKSVDIIFSGHIQSEDNMKQHLLYEGDLFRQMRHMHVPGIDMLTAMPERLMNAPDEHFPPLGGAQEIINWATGPKTVSSIARLYGKKDVMSEISAHMEGGAISNERRICATLLQYALGVTVFTSYHRDIPDELKVVNEKVDIVSSRMNGGEVSLQVGLYYPLQQMWPYAIPADVEEFTPSKKEMDMVIDVTQYSFSKANRELLINQVDPEIIGWDLLKEAKFSDGKFTCGCGYYDVLVIPACAIDENLENEILNFANNDVKVIILTHPLLSRAMNVFNNVNNITILNNDQDIAKEIINNIKVPNVKVIDGGKSFVCQTKIDKETNTHKYLLVNFEEKEYYSKVEFSGADINTIEIYDVNNDRIVKTNGKNTQNGCEIEIIFKPYCSYVITAKQ